MSAGWTADRIEVLRKLWTDGLTATQVAAEMGGGLNKNAVIGKVHRLKIERDKGRKLKSRPASKRKKTGPAVDKSAEKSVSVARVVPHPIVFVEHEPIALPMSGRVTLLELRAGMCRWPVGHPGDEDFHFCAERVANVGGSYCGAHAQIAYVPTRDRGRAKDAGR